MAMTEDEFRGFFLVLCSVLIAVIHHTGQPRIQRNHVPTPALTRIGFMAELVVESGRDIRDLLRMDYSTFRRLTTMLQEQSLISPSRYITIEEQVAIFLLTVGHNSRNRLVQNHLRHSGSTISLYFHRALDAICQLYGQYMVMPSPETPDFIKCSSRFFPYFQDCIGAIGGCHVPINVSKIGQGRFRNTKGFTTQNVMAAIGFDMRFQYVLAGWEGSATNSDILVDALSRPSGRFTVPEGKYYLVDSSYANTRSFIAPFPGFRYHLSDYVNGGNPQNPQELYNHRHASLRGVVDRTFGLLKKRFPMLRAATRGYDLATQVKLVIATCILHNFILDEGSAADDIQEPDGNLDELIPPEIAPPAPPTITHPSQLEELHMGSTLRESIMMQMWLH